MDVQNIPAKQACGRERVEYLPEQIASKPSFRTSTTAYHICPDKDEEAAHDSTGDCFGWGRRVAMASRGYKLQAGE